MDTGRKVRDGSGSEAMRKKFCAAVLIQIKFLIQIKPPHESAALLRDGLTHTCVWVWVCASACARTHVCKRPDCVVENVTFEISE